MSAKLLSRLKGAASEEIAIQQRKKSIDTDSSGFADGLASL